MENKGRNVVKNKKMQGRFIFRTVILALLLAALVYAIVANTSKTNEPSAIGDTAPNFALTQINENNELEKINLSDLKGKGVMLNFWATYCKPCEEEIPYMESLYGEYANQDIEIVAVSLDYGELVIHQFIDKHSITFPVVHDKSDVVRDMYKVGPIPTTLFIDPEGVIVERVAGALSLDRLEEYFKMIQP